MKAGCYSHVDDNATMLIFRTPKLGELMWWPYTLVKLWKTVPINVAGFIFLVYRWEISRPLSSSSNFGFLAVSLWSAIASIVVASSILFLPLKTLKMIIYEHSPHINPNQADTLIDIYTAWIKIWQELSMTHLQWSLHLHNFLLAK